MRTIIFVAVAGITFLLLPAAVPPAHAGCEIVGCSTECWFVGPGHRRCQRRCTRRCWHDAPRYYPPAPQPDYTPRYDPAPQYRSAGPVIDPAAVVAFGLTALVIFAIVAAIIGASADATAREIAAIEQASFDNRTQAHANEQETHAINSHIASQEADAFQQGRRAADDEWKEFTRNG